MMKTLSAVFAQSSGVERQQLVFDETTGLIVEFGQLGIPTGRLDWHFPDHCLAFAGLGDVHIHAREDASGSQAYKEDFISASSAALNGGVTHVADMPNNPIPPIDEESYRRKLALTQKALIPFLLYAGIGPETRPLKAAVPYKVYMGPSIGELFFRKNEQLTQVLAHYQGQAVSFHCEDPEEMERHQNHPHHHQKRPVSCEVLATATALSLIQRYQLSGKLCHYSAGQGLPLIRQARQQGAKVSLEVTPQHLFFSQSQLNDASRGFFQMNPPIREEEDREALLAAARQGEIEFLATDHAPHTREEKQKGISGLTGLDTYGAFVTWLLKTQGFTPERVALMAAENPGRFANTFLPTLKAWSIPHQKLGKGFGFLAPGFVANVTVLNLVASTTVRSHDLKTKVAHSPFEGITFPGRVEQVFLAGKAYR